jgi:hypothetical protein
LQYDDTLLRERERERASLSVAMPYVLCNNIAIERVKVAISKNKTL